MRVSPSQLVPGCMLLRDVHGKTNRPIIPKNTILTKTHITVLHKFLIEEVDVSEKLNNGNPFIPDLTNENNEEISFDVTSLSFKGHYYYVVGEFKKLFESWRSKIQIDISVIVNLIVPLMNRLEEIGSSVYTLHQYANRKDYFYHHCVSISLMSAHLAKKMGYSKEEWFQVGIAGILCDAGMARLGHFAFKKEGNLSSDEKNEIKKHPTFSYRMVEHVSNLPYAVKLAILQHHERIDGSGYPLGLSQGKIHRFARIIAVCDIYHAMTSERVYRDKQSPFKVIEELQENQFSKLDPRVVQVFVDAITNFSVGTKVLLSDNNIGEIVFIDPKQPTRPIVRLENGEILSLSNQQLYITEVI